MAGNYRTITLLLLAAGFLATFALPCMAQQEVNLSYIGNATVTLYYYDNATGTRGAVVPMPDNPQYVNANPSLSAPGMYTFSHVPAGQWYYLEADHNGSKWYAIFYMEEGIGTKSQNVHIPPLTALNDTATPAPAVASAPAPAPLTVPSPTPMPMLSGSPTPVPSPGLPPLVVVIAVAIAAALALFFISRR